MSHTGFKAIFMRSVLQIARRPIYWVAFFILPLFCFLFFTTLLQEGLPPKVPAAMVDLDGSSLSRSITRDLNGMQMTDIVESCNSFTEARRLMQEGKVFGCFLIPENFQSDLLAGRKPKVTFYTNATYFVPASILFKTFKTTALYTKAGVAATTLESVGVPPYEIETMILPVNIHTRGIHNPGMNYAIYLCNSFLPCVMQLMILLVTCFSLGQEIKYGTSKQLLKMADGSIVKALTAKLLPQTCIWLVTAFFMEAWLFRYNGFPVHGSWFWLTLSELMFVLACQGMAVFFFGLLPNLRLSLSVSALTGILSFSIAAFSFPLESMYQAIGIFSWILPTRYNFLIYIDQALNGTHIYYSRLWFVAYIAFMLLPLTMLWNIKRNMSRPVYVP